MFEPKDNPGYDKLTENAAQLIAKWTRNDWYESSTDSPLDEANNKTEADASNTDLDMD